MIAGPDRLRLQSGGAANGPKIGEVLTVRFLRAAASPLLVLAALAACNHNAKSGQRDVQALVSGLAVRKPARLSILIVVIAVLASLGGWFVFTRNTAPDEDAGRAWLNGFVDLVTSSTPARCPRTHRPLAVFPSWGPGPATGCQSDWRKSDGLGPIVVSQDLELAREEPEPCDQAQFGQLSTVLRQSEGVTPRCAGLSVDRDLRRAPAASGCQP